MRLILIRHAKAEDRSSVPYPDDAQRPLSDMGRQEQAALARVFKRMGIKFDHLATSPKVRAHETAEILARGMKWTHALDVSPVLGDAFTVEGAIKWLRDYPETATIVCVGHEPDLSILASTLLISDDSVWIDFKKSGVIAIDFDRYAAPGEGTLLYFLRPKQILQLDG